MALKEVESVVVGLGEENPEFRGYFLGSHAAKVQGKERIIHDFETEEESRIGVWGSAALDRLLVLCKKGLWTEVKFTGLKKSTKKGESDMKLFKVFQDSDRRTSSQDIPF